MQSKADSSGFSLQGEGKVFKRRDQGALRVLHQWWEEGGGQVQPRQRQRSQEEWGCPRRRQCGGAQMVSSCGKWSEGECQRSGRQGTVRVLSLVAAAGAAALPAVHVSRRGEPAGFPLCGAGSRVNN